MTQLNYHQSEQWILFKVLDNILKFHESDEFNSIIQISSEHPELMFNRVFACRPEVAKFYLGLTPLQRSFLQPQVRLFRILPKKAGEREISFSSNFNAIEFNEIAQGSPAYQKEPGRLDGSALKKITISEKPERPTDVNLHCKIELFFDNIVSIYNTNILELITTPIRRDKFNSEDYRIKLMLGWNIPDDSSGLQFTPEEKRIIGESNIVYLLEIIKHSISFRENGSIDLSIEYMGALESQMKSQNSFDIFNMNLINEDLVDTTSLRNYFNSEEFEDLISSEQEQLEESLEKNDKITSTRTQLEIQSLIIQQYTELTREKEQISRELADEADKQVKNIKTVNEEKNKRIDELNKRNDYIDTKLADLELLILRDKYAKILEHIIRSDRMFYLPIKPDTFKLLGSFEKGNFEDQSDVKLTNEQQRNVLYDLQSISPIKINYGETDGVFNILNKTTYSEITENLNTLKTAKSKDEIKKAAFDVFNKRFSSLNENRKFGGNAYFENFNVYYILLGDIINIVTSLSGFRDKINLALGPVRFGDKSINLAQIPISLSHFSSFFVNKVIKEIKKSYYLWNFIQDIISDLVLPSMVGNNLTLPTMPALNVTSTTVLSPNILNPGKNYQDTELMNFLSRGYTLGRDVYSYLIIYCRASELPYRSGDLVEDSLDGIYHFGIGRNNGIVKSVNFVKLDQPKLTDARLTGDELNRAGRVLREHYNCKLSCLGNPIFIPGCHFYFDGSYLGMRGKQATDTLGLGGYYFVNAIESTFYAGRYDMEIEGWWQSMGRPQPVVDLVSNAITSGGGKKLLSGIGVVEALKYGKLK